MLALFAAISTNNCIGKNNDLPWHLPEDLKRFKALTSGHVVLMGRKTWESIPEKFRPLPKRKNIVITRQENYSVPEGVDCFSSIDAALDAYSNHMVFSIGGGEIYRQTIEKADELYITHVDQHVDGDAFFPEIDENVWEEIERDERDGFAFVRYIRMT